MEPIPTYIKILLDRKADEYNSLDFIPEDPVSIPHIFHLKEDIEISGFLTATIAWGQRKTILKNARSLMEMMDDAPYDFVSNFTDPDLRKFERFIHRTFNAEDCKFFLRGLRDLYRHYGGLESAFLPQTGNNLKDGIIGFRTRFLSISHPARTAKHIADPSAGASAKRLNMFLRWMVRKDNNGVDFGIWKTIKPSQLYCPLDVHTGETARRLGILKSPQNNWKAVEELTQTLRTLDPEDPVKYDYALFGMGLNRELGLSSG